MGGRRPVTRTLLRCSVLLATLPLPVRGGQGVPVFRASAQLVLVDAAVELKRTGDAVPELTPADFVVSEDGVPQPVSSISEDQLPLSVVLVFDLTDTVHPQLLHLGDGAAAVLRRMRAGDEVAVMTASSSARLVQRFTRDRMTAMEGVDMASAHYDAGEPTFLFEDLWGAAEVSASSRVAEARRVQIWMTDGSANDQDSERGMAHHAPAVLHGEAEARKAVLAAGVTVSALVERGQAPLTTGRYGDLERYAALTGGPLVEATAGDAAERMAGLLDSLRHRYTLGYRPSEAKPEGTVCHLHVELSPAFWAAHPRLRARDVVVRARESYVRAPGSSPRGGSTP